MVNKLEINGNLLRANREIEGGTEDVYEVQLPAVLTIQTGINEPRYVSILGIRKASRIEINVQGLAELGMDATAAGPSGSMVHTEKLSLPISTKVGEILSGSLEDMAGKLVGIIKEKGGL